MPQLDHWKEEESDRKKRDKSDVALYFSQGGTYTTGQLDTRAAMYISWNPPSSW